MFPRKNKKVSKVPKCSQEVPKHKKAIKPRKIGIYKDNVPKVPKKEKIVHIRKANIK